MNTSLIICIVGGLTYLFAGLSPGNVQPNGHWFNAGNQIGELGKWAFIIGLLAYLFGH